MAKIDWREIFSTGEKQMIETEKIQADFPVVKGKLNDVAIQATSGIKLLMFKNLLIEAGYMDGSFQGPMKNVVKGVSTWTLYLKNVDIYNGEWMFLEAQKILLIKHYFLLARKSNHGI